MSWVSRVRSLGGLLLASWAAWASAGTDTFGFGLYMDRVPTMEEARANFTGAKFEPKVGCYLGAFLDLDSTLTETFQDMTGRIRRLPWEFESRTGRVHATYFFYMGYGSRLAKDWIAKLGNEGKIVHIALEPNNGLEFVREDAYLINLAKGMADTRAPIFLRFASEMNGPWVRYSGNPALYREKFRLVARVMREHAPNVAMVWCPYATPVRTIDSYYPGDDYVDWVGVNIYSVTFFDQNRRTPASHVHPATKLDYIYRKYSARKPVMIGEFGATHFSALENRSTTDFARRALKAMYEALPRVYPRVKAISYFNVNNLVLEHRRNNNYALTQNPEVLALYREIVAHPYFLSQKADPQGFAMESWAVPVEGNASGAMLPLRPVKVRQHQVLSGTVRLSGWMRDHRGDVTMRFLANGRTFHVGRTKETWEVDLDTRRLQRGPLKLELRAERRGEVIARYPITVVVKN